MGLSDWISRARMWSSSELSLNQIHMFGPDATFRHDVLIDQASRSHQASEARCDWFMSIQSTMSGRFFAFWRQFTAREKREKKAIAAGVGESPPEVVEPRATRSAQRVITSAALYSQHRILPLLFFNSLVPCVATLTPPRNGSATQAGGCVAQHGQGRTSG